MSHISTVRLNIEAIGDPKLVAEYLSKLGYTVTDQEVNDFYGNRYNYKNVVLKVQLKNRVFGLTEKGELIGDSYGLQDEYKQLQKAITTAVIASTLQSQGYDVYVNKEGNDYQIEAEEPELVRW